MKTQTPTQSCRLSFNVRCLAMVATLMLFAQMAVAGPPSPPKVHDPSTKGKVNDSGRRCNSIGFCWEPPSGKQAEAWRAHIAKRLANMVRDRDSALHTEWADLSDDMILATDPALMGVVKGEKPDGRTISPGPISNDNNPTRTDGHKISPKGLPNWWRGD